MKKGDIMDKQKLGILLIIAGVLIGSGVGQIISMAIGKSVVGAASTLGLGIGFLAAYIAAKIEKKK